MRYEKRIEREIDILMGHYVVEPHKLDNSNMCIYIYDEHSRMMIVPITKKFSSIGDSDRATIVP